MPYSKKFFERTRTILAGSVSSHKLTYDGTKSVARNIEAIFVIRIVAPSSVDPLQFPLTTTADHTSSTEMLAAGVVDQS